MHKELLLPKYLNPESIDRLSLQISELEKENVRFIVLKGHEGSFCEGLDIKWIAGNDPAGFKEHILRFSEFLKKLQTGNFISIALADGVVSGGGLGVLCACDHVIVSRISAFSLPEGLLGLVPGVILPALLNRLSANQVRNLFLTGEGISASVAREWGLSDSIIEPGGHEEAIKKTISSMQSYKKGAVGDFKKFLYNSQFDKDRLAAEGADLLLAKLSDPEINERLITIAEFLD
ncbi:MAG: enoyl-CoA hydratase/isomerase family protein [Bacteroidia bacterium]